MNNSAVSLKLLFWKTQCLFDPLDPDFRQNYLIFTSCGIWKNVISKPVFQNHSCSLSEKPDGPRIFIYTIGFLLVREGNSRYRTEMPGNPEMDKNPQIRKSASNIGNRKYRQLVCHGNYARIYNQFMGPENSLDPAPRVKYYHREYSSVR